MKKLLVSMILCMLLSACKEKNKTAETPTLAEDSATIRSTVLDFYNWYSVNYEKLMSYDLYDGAKEKDAPPYKIKWDEVTKYHAYIKDSVPDLGEAFLANQREMFRKADSAFKVDLDEDVPYYFDYDWYTNTQEDPKYILEEMQKSKLWMIEHDGPMATVDIKGYNEDKTKEEWSVIKLTMKKENGTWKIAKIGED